MFALTGNGGSNPPLSANIKGASVSKNQHLSIETCYNKDISPFKAVIMSSQEARFINEQANLGFIKLAEKPTTIAIQKFKDGKLEILPETPVV
jgi:DNA-directed RNA polymerase subunit K/omega